MSVITELLVGLGIDSDSYDKGIASAGDKADSFVDNITNTLGPAIAGAFAVGGAAVAGFAVNSVAQFSDFQASMNEVFTLLPGISNDAMGKMTDQVKDFSKEFGVLPEDVVPALYQSLSAGVPPDNVFSFLEAANKASTAGVTDLSVAVDGISSVVNAYGSDVIDATKASDLMFTAVKLGKTNFEQLSQSLFNVTPTAAAAGVKFDNITAALAAMTLQGVPTSVATTQLRSALVELSKDGTKTSDLFEKLAGKSFKEFVAQGGNLQTALQLLETHAKDSNVGINDLFSSVEAGNAALALTGRGTDAFSNALAGMNASAGATDAAFATMNTGIKDAIDDMKAAFAVFVLDVGEKLAPLAQVLADGLGTVLPIIADNILALITPATDFVNVLLTSSDPIFEITNALYAFSPLLGDLVGYFLAATIEGDRFNDFFANLPAPIQGAIRIIEQISDLIGDNWTPILAGVATVLGVVVVSAIASFIASIATVAAPIIAAIAIGAAMYKAYTENFLGIQTIVTTVINGINKIITAVMSVVLAFWKQNGADIMKTATDVFTQVLNIVTMAMDAINTIVSSVLTFIANFWTNHKTLIVATVTSLWQVVSGLFKAGLDIIEGLVKIVTGIINGDWATFAAGCAQVVTGLWSAIKTLFTSGFDFVKNLISLNFAVISDLFGGFAKKAIDLGKNIINGIIEGVKNGVGALVNAVEDAANSALDAAKSALGISSPSKAFYDQVGMNSIDGIINAFDDGRTMLTRALANTMDFTLGSFDYPAEAAQYPAAAMAGIAPAGGGVTQQFQIDAHYKTVQDEMTLRDRIRLESLMNMPTNG